MMIPLTNIQIVHTEELDELIRDAENALQKLNAHAAQLSDKETGQLMKEEAESSCKLALGEQPLSFDFLRNADSKSDELREALQG